MNSKQKRQPRPTWRQYNELKREYKVLWDDFAAVVEERERLKEQLHNEKMITSCLEKANRSNHESGMRYLDIIGNLTQKLEVRQQV
jgi:hypothetical protein